MEDPKTPLRPSTVSNFCTNRAVTALIEGVDASPRAGATDIRERALFRYPELRVTTCRCADAESVARRRS